MHLRLEDVYPLFNSCLCYIMNCILREGTFSSDELFPETLMILLSKIIPLKKIEHNNHSQIFLLNNGKTTMRYLRLKIVTQNICLLKQKEIAKRIFLPDLCVDENKDFRKLVIKS